MKESGTYALVIALDAGLSLRVGKLGVYSLQPGYYVYVGSALGGLSGRVRRHLRLEKRLHWHVDYLLQEASVAQVWYALGQDKLECVWNVIVKDLPGAESSIPGFGASDCECSSHLTYFPAAPPFELFAEKLSQSGFPQVHKIELMSGLMPADAFCSVLVKLEPYAPPGGFTHQ